MRVRALFRIAAAGAGLSLGVWCGWGQTPDSKLPVTAPTAPTAPQTAPPAIAAQPFRQSDVARKARVSWEQGELTIVAENASLNQILIEITRQTGMKVTGGVTEERVYGEYGPGAPGAVLASLLLGTGSNMLLKENAANGPVELVLSPRTGGATPPGPSTYARSREGDDDLPPQQTVPRSRGRGALEPSRPAQTAAAGQAGVVQEPAAQATGGQTAAGSAGAAVGAPAATPTTTDQQSPNGVKTPQEIYDQLMKMQQQKAAAQQHPPAATPQ